MKNYLPLKTKSSALGDEYYRCLNEKLTRNDPQGIDECLKVARKYRRALRQQLRDLERFTDPNFVQHERNLVSQYLQLVEHDLTNLTQGQIDELLAKKRRPIFDQ